MKTTIEIRILFFVKPVRLPRVRGSRCVRWWKRGLRRVVIETKGPAAPFKLRRASFKGKGLQADVRGASWDRLRDLAYEGRGG